MIRILAALTASFAQIIRSRRDLLLENLALRQQFAVLTRKQLRSRVGSIDKLFWIVLRRLWPQWRSALLIVQPSTVVRWHRKGFKLYWKWISRHRVSVGRKPLSKKLRELIFHIMNDNPTWGAPRIHGELRMDQRSDPAREAR
jgi:putative transposase